MRKQTERVCVQLQLPTTAGDVALHAFARCKTLLRAGRAAIDRYLLLAGPTAANPQQLRAAARRDRRTDHRRTSNETFAFVPKCYVGKNQVSGPLKH